MTYDSEYFSTLYELCVRVYVYVVSMLCLCCVYVVSVLCLCCVYVVSMLYLCCVYVVSMLCLCCVYVVYIPQRVCDGCKTRPYYRAPHGECHKVCSRRKTIRYAREERRTDSHSYGNRRHVFRTLTDGECEIPDMLLCVKKAVQWQEETLALSGTQGT